MEKGTIKVEPYMRECLGSNSYDVHLGSTLATYKEHTTTTSTLLLEDTRTAIDKVRKFLRNFDLEKLLEEEDFNLISEKDSFNAPDSLL